MRFSWSSVTFWVTECFTPYYAFSAKILAISGFNQENVFPFSYHHGTRLRLAVSDCFYAFLPETIFLRWSLEPIGSTLSICHRECDCAQWLLFHISWNMSVENCMVYHFHGGSCHAAFPLSCDRLSAIPENCVYVIVDMKTCPQRDSNPRPSL